MSAVFYATMHVVPATSEEIDKCSWEQLEALVLPRYRRYVDAMSNADKAFYPAAVAGEFGEEGRCAEDLEAFYAEHAAEIEQFWDTAIESVFECADAFTIFEFMGHNLYVQGGESLGDWPTETFPYVNALASVDGLAPGSFGKPQE